MGAYLVLGDLPLPGWCWGTKLGPSSLLSPALPAVPSPDLILWLHPGGPSPFVAQLYKEPHPSRMKCDHPELLSLLLVQSLSRVQLFETLVPSDI